MIYNRETIEMKQIMQKPGVGWIRGDTANADEALSKELSTLSKENRELRERIAELESKVSLKVPKIELDITQPVIDDHFFLVKHYEMQSILLLYLCPIY